MHADRMPPGALNFKSNVPERTAGHARRKIANVAVPFR